LAVGALNFKEPKLASGMTKLRASLFAALFLAPIRANAGPETAFRADLDGDTRAEVFDIEGRGDSLTLTIRRPNQGSITAPNFARSVRPHVWARAGNSVTLRTNPRWSHPHFYEQMITISYVSNAYVVSRVQRMNRVDGLMREVITCDINFVTGQGSYQRREGAPITRFAIPARAPLVTAWPRTIGWPEACGN
jgi:hypothetical protein